MVNYFKILINIVVLVASFGLIGPFLISATDTILVLSGWAYIFVVLPLFLYFFNHRFIKYVKENFYE